MYVWRDCPLPVCVDYHVHIWFAWIIIALMLLSSEHNWFTVACMVEMATTQ